MSEKIENNKERIIKMIDTAFIECYREGFDDGYKEGHHHGEIDGVMNVQIDEVSYQRGLNDAWECARKLWSMSPSERAEIFHDKNCMLEHTASKAIQMIKEYEEKKETQKIKVGDIVTINEDDAEEFIVTAVGIAWHPDQAMLLSRNGMWARAALILNLIPTGEHCDIEKCFKYKVF